ncbi:DinB family protein [Kitasatospora sp. NPDC059571]|uniref:DinB family protein n=1 Tax=Kitasatospora sp. NPDC059571 TaxID=3346871 RepID=UPI003692DAD7
MSGKAPFDRSEVHAELDRVREEFHRLVASAGPADLAGPTSGTRWTNEQLLFHMLFGYIITRVLMPLVRTFGRLPRSAGRLFARILDAATTPFDAVNYLGPRLAVRVLRPSRQLALLDRFIASLHRRLDRETVADLALGMHFPVRWDPFFQDRMTLADLYRYPALHFDFHRRQLTLTDDS